MKRAIRDLEAKAEAEALQAPVSAAPVPMPPPDTSRQNKIRDLRAEMDNLDQQIAQKTESQTKLEASIASYQHRVEASSSRELDLIELTRDYETIQRMYTNLLMKSQEAQVAANLERRQIGEQFKVIDPARVPERPFSPDRKLINLSGLGAGLAVGLGLVLLLEIRDTSFRTDDDIVAVLSLPVLASVPAIVTMSERRATRRRNLVLAGMFTIFAVCAGLAVFAWREGYLDRWL